MLLISVMELDVIYIYILANTLDNFHNLEVAISYMLPLASDVIYICSDAGCYLHP